MLRGDYFTQAARKIFLLVILAGLAGCRQEKGAVRTGEIVPAKTTQTIPPAAKPAAPAGHVEQTRTDCVVGRRLICGRVLKSSPDGLVIDSGYTDLLRPPLIQSWVIPGIVSASRDPNALELNEPGTPCVGLVFLTDIPKRPKVKNFDYVVIMGYPAGQFAYYPTPLVEKKIRRFSAGLDTAVRLVIQAEENHSQSNPPR